MKRLIFAAIAVAVASTAFSWKTASESGYVITLKATGFRDSTLFQLYNLDLEKVVDSAYLIKGKLVFKGHVNEPVQFMLSSQYNPVTNERPKTVFFWVANKEIKIEGNYGDFRYARITGSTLNDDQSSLGNLVKKYDVARDSLLEIFFKDTENNKYVWDIINRNDKITDSLKIGFIKNNPDKRVALKELTYLKSSMSKIELKEIYERLSPEFKKSIDGQGIYAYINLKKIPAVGDKITEIKGKDLAGKEHALTNIKGKIILLDF